MSSLTVWLLFKIAQRCNVVVPEKSCALTDAAVRNTRILECCAMQGRVAVFVGCQKVDFHPC